ncbi:MAG: dephospho-CoA kinase [Alphaproteobacteria bacterium]|nr:dephospho-CoA kinase [Alphaproteobacteria bacterium]
MRILGLTGSIGTGKSVAARTFRRLRIPVHDADGVVHALLAKGGRAVPVVARMFPGVVGGGAVDRKKLGTRVFADRAELKRLEAVLHPMVRASERRFLAANRRKRLVVLDIPLLFETGAERRCHAVLVVSASRAIQRQRVMRRRGMTEEKLAQILSHQMPDAEKRRRADFVVPTGNGFRSTLRRILGIAKHLACGPWPRKRHAGNRARHGNHGA